jgi:hypothetical protein
MRQAVVIIHGIGEQLPMSTLRRFVAAVIEGSQPDGLRFYSKPDRISDTLELRRLTANKEYTGKNPTDFYELYWQHLMTGTTFAHIQAWLWILLLRRPGSVPRRLQPVWWLMWALIILAGVSLSTYTIWFGRPPVVEGIVTVVLLYLVRHLVQPLLNYFGIKYIGDAARYLSPFPENVGIRHAIRSAGLDLLRGLHLDPLRRYERIIVVGHSLGSVIAYDVLTHLWQEMHSKVEQLSERNDKPKLEELHHLSESESHPSPLAQPALDALSALESTIAQEPPADESEQLELNRRYRQHQHALWAEYRKLGFPWRITDLVTLGSPLTYAEFLLANNLRKFSEAKGQREFPTCPPTPEDERDDEEPGDRGLLKRVLPGETSERGQVRILHHGALFACTRWTNLYFPDDIIGGPLSFVEGLSSANLAGRIERFGLGVHDVRVDGDSATPLISHVKYWAAEEEQAVKALRAALDLGEND